MKNIDILPGATLVELTDCQILMLQLSDEDIKAGRLFSHEKLNEEDLKWLSEMFFKTES